MSKLTTALGATAPDDDDTTTAAEQEVRLRERQEDLLDEAIEASFPASDPIAVMQLLSST